ncbi:YkgJ family cysteine cluster protein [Halorussus gelatinilyticus]|uniref:YkgJ family cysteine cluster protein n=1 Tax=Halorussus gelatinilyticus TaxID=2937524 RepID=A0A8U0IQS9_9EURY|nr:YkgJ family cysteine cluster protein [Halorussus gelatinilyticus]UPW02379.1 YkgJ family cysteine cluster protein [Halorussus gelatinilyticus]
MDVNCEGCAGCCIDWRAVAPAASDHERRGPREPLDDAYNLVPLTRDDARAFLDAGLADALTPRLWRDESGVEIDGVSVSAIDGKPAFFLGLRKPPKPVAPFDTEPAWLPTCVFLDPTTLQCRIHDDETYPEECADYPGHNLKLDQETECERVEDAFGGTRLADDDPPEDLPGFLLGPQAVGQKVFVFPDPERLSGVVGRLADGESTAGDRALFVAAAVAAAPGTTAVNRERFESALSTAREADSWAGRAIADWEARAGGERPAAEDGESAAGDRSPAADPRLAEAVEVARGAPETPGWDAE